MFTCFTLNCLNAIFLLGFFWKRVLLCLSPELHCLNSVSWISDQKSKETAIKYTIVVWILHLDLNCAIVCSNTTATDPSPTLRFIKPWNCMADLFDVVLSQFKPTHIYSRVEPMRNFHQHLCINVTFCQVLTVLNILLSIGVLPHIPLPTKIFIHVTSYAFHSKGMHVD